MINNPDIGIVGLGIYLPKTTMNAAEIAAATGGHWNEQAVIDKLGIEQKYLPAANGDGTQEMGALAALKAIAGSGIEPQSIDLVLSIGEEWKEYPLTTSALYIQQRVGALNSWGIDLQNRCCTTIAAMKIAKDMMVADEQINTVLIAGGYRNGDLVDFTDPAMSMMYNLSTGGGAMILQKNCGRNRLLGSHLVGDGSLARAVGVEYGGTEKPISAGNIDQAHPYLRIFQAEHMKERLNEVSMPNWFLCVEQALNKSGLNRTDIDYAAILHFKRSMHLYMLDKLGLRENQSIYLSRYGHIGQIDQILSLQLAVESGKLKAGSHALLIAAGIGYVWAAQIVRWG